MEIPIYQVDAFASRVFAGNPAAVCPLESWLPDSVLQAIAAENNLSETAFLVKRAADYALRWFTPTTEVDLCGHATLGAAYVIAERLEPGRGEISFDTRSGVLDVSRDGDLFTLDFPAIPAQPITDSAEVAAALGAAPRELWGAADLMAVFAREAEVSALNPDMTKIAALEARGLIVTAPGDDCDFVSRFFAPGSGIPEDPVTGSAHCILTPYWARRLDKTKLLARQISRRGGELTVEDRGTRIFISGRVAPYLEGHIRV